MIELSRNGIVTRIDQADGGRIVSLVIAGVERILPKALARASEPALYWGCYPMVPWPGRLSHGRIPAKDGEVRLDANLPPSAIHGLGFDKSWEIVERSETDITMRCELRGLGWPFGGHALQTLRMGTNRLELELQVGGYTKAGPAGLGWHPWFTRPPTGDIGLRVDASEVLVLDADQAPTGEVRPVTPREDLRSGPPLGDRRLDHVYVRTTGPAIVRWPDRSCASNTTRVCKRSSFIRHPRAYAWNLRRCGRTRRCSRRPASATRGCAPSSRETP